MKYRIHYRLDDDTHDSFVISGGDIEEIREKTSAELEKRNAQGIWSEKLS